MITIQTDTGELQGHDFISRLFCGTVNWFGHLMSDIAGSSGGRGNANGGRGSGIVIPFYELFGLCDFGSFQVGENRNTLAVLATKAFQDGYDARWGLTMAIPVVLCDLSIRFIWSVRRFFGDKKQLSECIPSDKQPDLRMMVLVGNGTLCIVDGVDAAVRSGGNMLVFFIGIKEAMQTGATGYAVGMLAGFAAQSGATSMAIFASTGTAISSLSGAATTNATLAQLGGGALSAGGLGMAGGQAVLTGLKAAPLLMVEGILFNIKGNKVLENAKDIEYQTFKAVGKMQDIEIELKRLALLSKSVQDELQQLYDVYLRLVAQAEKTVERTTEYVNFTAAEKLNFQKTCLAIKLISVLSKQDLLDEAKEGEMNKVLDKETKETIQKVHQAAGDGKLLVA